MTKITLRGEKGAALSYQEMDDNFIHILNLIDTGGSGNTSIASRVLTLETDVSQLNNDIGLISNTQLAFSFTEALANTLYRVSVLQDDVDLLVSEYTGVNGAVFYAQTAMRDAQAAKNSAETAYQSAITEANKALN